MSQYDRTGDTATEMGNTLLPIFTGAPICQSTAGDAWPSDRRSPTDLSCTTRGPDRGNPDRDDVRQRSIKRNSGIISRSLLQRASELIDGITSEDEVNHRLCLHDLLDTLALMWEDAVSCSQPYMDILAIVEQGVRASLNAVVTPDQVRLFREAVIDLSRSYLTPEHADVVRSRYLDVGFGALSVLDGVVPDTGECGE